MASGMSSQPSKPGQESSQSREVRSSVVFGHVSAPAAICRSALQQMASVNRETVTAGSLSELSRQVAAHS